LPIYDIVWRLLDLKQFVAFVEVVLYHRVIALKRCVAPLGKKITDTGDLRDEKQKAKSK
jgi:hypothetical protein